MAVFNEPQKWAQTLGKDADVTTIPNTARDADPSIDKIFPSVFSIPLAQGGRAIPRSVLNGLFKLLGDWCFYNQNGGIASYSNTFDYAVGSFVKYNDEFYRCIQANGASTEVKVPTETTYWSKITTLADVANAFADQDLSNVTNAAKIAMAHNSMPSNTSDNLTVGASGSIYSAPADGSFWGYANVGNTTDYIQIVSQSANSRRSKGITSSVGTGGVICWLPVSKGETVSFTYTATKNLSLRFFYANGSVSEQA